MDFRIEIKTSGEKVAVVDAKQVLIPEKEVSRANALGEIRTAKMIRDNAQKIVDAQNEKLAKFTAIISEVDPTVEITKDGEVIEAETLTEVIN